jgi:hypothetical protein
MRDQPVMALGEVSHKHLKLGPVEEGMPNRESFQIKGGESHPWQLIGKERRKECMLSLVKKKDVMAALEGGRKTRPCSPVKE